MQDANFLKKKKNFLKNRSLIKHNFDFLFFLFFFLLNSGKNFKQIQYRIFVFSLDDVNVCCIKPSCFRVFSVPPAGAHTPPQTFSDLAGRLGQDSRDERNVCRHSELAEGRRTRGPAAMHHHLLPRGPPLSQH